MVMRKQEGGKEGERARPEGKNANINVFNCVGCCGGKQVACSKPIPYFIIFYKMYVCRSMVRVLVYFPFLSKFIEMEESIIRTHRNFWS